MILYGSPRSRNGTHTALAPRSLRRILQRSSLPHSSSSQNLGLLGTGHSIGLQTGTNVRRSPLITHSNPRGQSISSQVCKGCGVGGSTCSQVTPLARSRHSNPSSHIRSSQLEMRTHLGLLLSLNSHIISSPHSIWLQSCGIGSR